MRPSCTEDKKAAIITAMLESHCFENSKAGSALRTPVAINKHRGRGDLRLLQRQNTAHACISIRPGHSQTQGPLAAEEMYISLIHSGDLPGGCLSSDVPLNPEITLHCCLRCHSGQDVGVAGGHYWNTAG